MQVKIDGKDYKLNFGLAAINYLDNIYYVEQGGFKFGQGIRILMSKLLLTDPVAMCQAIKAATSTLDSKPSNDGIEEFLSTKFEKDEGEKFADELMGELESAPLTKGQAKGIRADVAKLQEEIEKKA